MSQTDSGDTIETQTFTVELPSRTMEFEMSVYDETQSGIQAEVTSDGRIWYDGEISIIEPSQGPSGNDGGYRFDFEQIPNVSDQINGVRFGTITSIPIPEGVGDDVASLHEMPTMQERRNKEQRASTLRNAKYMAEGNEDFRESLKEMVENLD